MKIPITKPFFGEEELLAVQEPLKNGWIVQGPHVKQFETAFAEFVGCSYAVAVNSCTAALHVAIAALGLQPGDEVIVPAFTWVSTANVVEYMGARPIFCDIDLETFNIDVKQIESCITSKTVGIIPVHLFGLCADMGKILQIAKNYNLWVVEDAACGLGARIQGRHAGTFGNAGCFSFHPRKSITTGEGGMITCQQEEWDTLFRILRDHGASRSDFSRHEEQAGFLLSEYNHLGYNYRMTDLQGAVGVAQLTRAAWILQRRRELAQCYDKFLAESAEWNTPVVPDGFEHGFQSYVCLYAPEKPEWNHIDALHRKRNEIMSQLEEKGIATRQGTHAPVLLGYYANKYKLKPDQYPNAVIADRLSLSLPLYAQMTDDEQQYVCRELILASR